jgi:hypothetical protein
MNCPSLPTPPSPPAAAPLPAWNQLPQDRRQELTATLADMILKQLPPRPSAPREHRDERP